MSVILPSALTENWVTNFQRTCYLRCPVVANYITGRMGVKNTPNRDNNDLYCLFTNTGLNIVIVRMVESADTESSTVRSDLGTAMYLVPGGKAAQVVTPTKNYLEVKGISGTSNIEVQFTGRVDLERVGFAKDDTWYPRILWDDNPDALLLVSSSAFTSNTVWAVTHNLGYTASIVLLDSNNVDITSLATITGVTANGYTATFGSAKVGTAYSSRSVV